MHQPIKDFDIREYPHGDVSQYFGENPSLYARMGLDGHNGIDIVGPHGSKLYAVEDGEIIDVRQVTNDTQKGGNQIHLLTADNRMWVYAHLYKMHVEVGDKVKEGDHIADMGNTGFVVSGSHPYWSINPYAGTHLHIGYRNVRRSSTGWSYPGSDVKIKVLDYDNGYKGAVDPYDLLEEVSRESEKTRLLTIISLLNKVVDLYKQLNALK